jgi:hypothetical protein
MTDTFSNGPSTPGGTAPNATPQAGDVTGTLAELERKLRELESELSSIGRRREQVEATPADTIGTLPTTPAGERLVDEALEPPKPMPVTPLTSPAPPAPIAQAPTAPAPVPPAPTSSAPVPPAPTAPSPPPPAPTSLAGGAGQPIKFMRPSESARPRASREPAGQSEPRAESEPSGEREPQWASAQQARQERPRPSEAQLASLAELRRFRDRLERFARDLAGEYDALLGRVMSGLTSTSTPASAGTPAPTASSPLASVPPAAGPTPVGDRPEAAQPKGPAAVQPMGLAAVQSTGPAAVQSTAEEAPAAPEAPEDMLFEGRVELGVGPFYDIVSLSAFERGLASLPYVVEASVRRFEASHAVVDVRLAAPVALVRELRRTVESDFSVREVADGRVLLTFDEA